MAPELHLLYEELRRRNELLCHNVCHRILQLSGIHEADGISVDTYHSPPTHFCHDTTCSIDARRDRVLASSRGNKDSVYGVHEQQQTLARWRRCPHEDMSKVRECFHSVAAS